MNHFIFTLKDTTQKAFNSFFWFLFFLHLVIIAAYVLNNENIYQRESAIITEFLFGFLFFIYNARAFKLKFKLIIFQRISFLLMIAFWISQMAWLPAIIVIIIIVFASFVAKKKSTASFTAENIIITKSLFKKVYGWKEVDNVVLKDHLLSVDLKNNHLIQIEIAEESYTIKEADFNQFCHSQLNK